MATDKDPVATSGGAGDRNVRNNFNKIVWVLLLIAALAVIAGIVLVRVHGKNMEQLHKSQITLTRANTSV